MWASEDCCIRDLYLIGSLESLFRNMLGDGVSGFGPLGALVGRWPLGCSGG